MTTIKQSYVISVAKNPSLVIYPAISRNIIKHYICGIKKNYSFNFCAYHRCNFLQNNNENKSKVNGQMSVANK